MNYLSPFVNNFFLCRCVNSVKHFTLEHDNRYYYFGIGQFDSLEELLEHFDCLPVLGSETGE